MEERVNLIQIDLKTFQKNKVNNNPNSEMLYNLMETLCGIQNTAKIKVASKLE